MKRCLVIAIGLMATTSAFAAELLPELGSYGSLERPKGTPRGSIILMAGGNGSLGITGDGQITRLQGNSLIRTRQAFVHAGYATLALDSWGSLSTAIEAMRKIAKPVIVVGTSRAATRMGSAVAADGIALTSAMLDSFQSSVGSPGALPPTLVVHHRNDTCRVTLPGLVEPFQQWSAGRVKVVWLSGGRDEGDPCEARGHHGFAGIEGQMVGAITGFARSVRPRP